MEKFDLVVIGGGPGGYPAAIRAAQLGASVALVEKEALGGTCLNWGCIPTKTLIAASELYERMRKSRSMGLRPGEVSYDYAAMNKRKQAVVEKLCGGVRQLLKAHGVQVLEGTASFANRSRLVVQSREQAIVEAGRVIVATGSVSSMPGFIPKGGNVMNSREFLDLKALPARLIVLGGGVIGCEFACMAAQLGVEVTVVEMLDDILIVLDKDIRAELRRHMEKTLGIRILTGQPMQDIEALKTKVKGRVGDESIEADRLLVSVGRRPFTEGLALDKAGVEAHESGAIPVDACCCTGKAGIYAVGDVTLGSTQLAHAATSQGISAAENALGRTQKPAETLVPACIFTSPEIGSVGLTEEAAREQGRKIKTGKYPFAVLGKAMAADETDGFLKWVVDAETDQILGAHAVGPHATDLIAEATVAVRMEMTAEELGRTVHCHPTFSEAWMEAAHTVHGTSVHQPPKRR